MMTCQQKAQMLPWKPETLRTYPSVQYHKIINTISKDDLMFLFWINLFRYDVTIRATGRFFTDFLESVDNIHTQFRFTYPKMQSPSMYLTSVDAKGCVLVYRSGRQGFTQYVMGKWYIIYLFITKVNRVGQLQQIAKDFFNLRLSVKVLDKANSSTGTKNFVIVTFRLDFDNRSYVSRKNIGIL